MSHTLQRPAARPESVVAGSPAVDVPPSEPLAATRTPWWRRHVTIALAMVLALSLPVLLTGRVWGLDWTVHLWLTWVQGAHITEGGPSFFTHTEHLGVFYPQYAFYGGTAYSIGGAISALLGGKALVAYTLMWMGAFAAAYGGLLWLSLQAGLDGWRAHAGSLIFITSPYWLTNAYARGAYSELVATSVLPLILAATIALVQADRVRFGPALALVGSFTILTGTHNITLVWGSIILAALGLVALWALPRHGLELSARRMAMIAAMIVLGVAVNAWFLLPNITFASRLQISAGPEPMLWWMSDWFDRPGVLFAPFRGLAKETDTSGLYTNLPMLALVWVVVSAAFAARSAERSMRRAMAGVGLLLGVMILLMVWHWPWLHAMPRFLQFTQFRFRLETYIVLLIALLAILTLRVSARAPKQARRRSPVLASVLIVSLGLGVWQTWSTGDSWGSTRQDTFNRGVQMAPPTWYDGGSFHDASLPLMKPAADRWSQVPLSGIKKDRFYDWVWLPAGEAPIGTNIGAGPYLIHVQGPVKVIGRTELGTLVLRRTGPDAPSSQAGAVMIRITPVKSGVIHTGRVISLIAIAGIALLLLWLALRAGVDALSRRFS